jgi:hypothetical protein
MSKKFKLKKDIVIPAGAVFDCIDEERRNFHNDNFGHIIGLTNSTSGELTYGIDFDSPGMEEWFDEV